MMLLHEELTHIYSQKKPRLHFGESFTLKDNTNSYCFTCGGPHLLYSLRERVFDFWMHVLFIKSKAVR